MYILNNTWFVGIFGGIISGIIVYFITIYFTNNFSKKEYIKTVKEENQKISKTLIMSISEGKIPSPDVIGSLLSSTAKRNSIELKDLNNIQETYDDLVSELFETIFIPVEKKQSLAHELIQAKKSSIALTFDAILERNLESITLSNSRERDLKRSLMRVFIMVMSSLISLFVIVMNEISPFDFYEDQKKFLSITVVSFSLVIASLSYISARKSTERIAKSKEKNRASSL